MGYSSIKVTMEIYSHLMEATNHEAAKNYIKEVAVYIRG